MQPAQHIRQMAPEHAAIGVQFVDDDVSQILEELRPPWMMRQHPRVQHVGIGEHNVSSTPNRTTCVLRCVPVVRKDTNRRVLRGQDLCEPVQLGQLVLGERLRREQVQCTGGGTLSVS